MGIHADVKGTHVDGMGIHADVKGTDVDVSHPQRLGGRGSAVRHHLMLRAYTRMLRAPMWMLVTRSTSVGAAVPFVTT
eukprot:1188162-Prorocentrum_minimum.AAC.3